MKGTFKNRWAGYVLLISIVLANRYSNDYPCYKDVCNRNSAAQYCDVFDKVCHLCDEVTDHCFSSLHIYNCSTFCYDTWFARDVEKLRVSQCKVPSPPRNGHYDLNKTYVPFNATLEVICDEGYILIQDEPLTCDNFSMWSGNKPGCEVTPHPYSTGTIVLVLFLSASVAVNVILMAKLYRNKKAEESKESVPSDTDNVSHYYIPTDAEGSCDISMKSDDSQHDVLSKMLGNPAPDAPSCTVVGFEEDG